MRSLLVVAAAIAFAAMGPMAAAQASTAPVSDSQSSADSKAQPKITISTQDNGDSTYGVHTRATCTGESVELWGTVHLLVDGEEADSGELENGEYDFTTPKLDSGDHTVQVTFDGNESYDSGESEEKQVTVA